MLTGRLLDVSTADIDMEVRPGVGPSPGLSFEAVSLAPKPHRFIYRWNKYVPRGTLWP